MIYLDSSTTGMMVGVVLAMVALLGERASAQYLDWPQQQYNQYSGFQRQPYQQQYQQQTQQFQQQQQYYTNYPQQYTQTQQAPQIYQPPQYQAPQYQPYQQGVPQYQQQQYPQLQQPQQFQAAPPPQQAPPPIYSQTVVIPQAPPPPPEAYLAQQQQQPIPQQSQLRVEAANIPRYHLSQNANANAQTSDVAFQHVDRARSIQSSSFDLDNKLFREQPSSFSQNQEKIELLAQPPPPPTPPTITQAPILRVPPPPARFVPTLRSLYNIDEPAKPEKNPEYKPDEIIVDSHHSAYFEDTQRTKPQSPRTRVVGGNVHSSSASVPQQVQGGQRPIHNAGVIANPSQQQFLRPNEVTQRPLIFRPQQQARPVSRPVSTIARPPPTQQQVRPRPQAAVRPQAPPPPPPPPAPSAAAVRVPARSHLAPQPAPVSAPAAATPAPRTAGEKFLQCCKGRKVAKPCERICSFDVLSKKTLTGMFLGTDPCPQSHGLDLMQCAADSDDHTECCLEKEVDRTSAGKKCLGFCNMKPGITFQADVSMLPCWSVLNDIKQCFRENLERQLGA